MPRKTSTEIQTLFRTAFEKQKADRSTGWGVEDSEAVVLSLVSAQTDKNGKEVKLTADASERINAALRITPNRVYTLIASELEKAGVVVDDTYRELILKTLDVTAFRTELVKGDVLKSAGKGKRKTSVVDLLK